MRRAPPRGRAALSLVETTLLLSLVGVVTAVTVPTLLRTVRVSKVSEASEHLQALAIATQAYYATPQPTPNGKRLECLPPSAGPTPPAPSGEPQPVDFAADPTHGPTWRALGFAPNRAVRFRYVFETHQAGCGPRPPEDTPAVLLRAEADLDQDGQLSSFERRLEAAGQELKAHPVLWVRDRVE